MLPGRRKPYTILSGAGAGAGAVLAVLAVMAAMRFLFGFLTLPELMLNTILRVMGGQAFSDALDRLYYAGRPLLFATILEGVLLLGVVLGLLYALLARPEPFTGKRRAIFNPPWGGIVCGLLVGLLLNVIFLPIVGQPLFASQPSGIYTTSSIPLWLGLVVLGLVYGLVLQALLPPTASGMGQEADAMPFLPADDGRRDFLRLVGGVLLALVGGAIVTAAGTVLNQGGLTSPVDNKNVDITEATNTGDSAGTATPQSVAQSKPPAATGQPPIQAPPTEPPATQPPPPETAAPQAEPSATAVPNVQASVPTDTAAPPPPPTNTAAPPTPAPTATNSPPPGIMVSDITPVASFYHVSKNFFDPSPSSADWKLAINGLVQNPYTLSYSQLTSMTPVEVVVGMMCISNPIGGGLIGNTRWKGVRLADLLARAKPKKGVVDVVMGAVDGYTDSIALQKAMDPDVVLAWEIAGAPLPPDHGFPARLLVPGIYGMKHVKWISSIELVNYDFKGYWQQPDQGWSDPAPVRTMSKIDYPAGGAIKLKQQTLSGVAFAGDRSISLVEISTDGGNSWNEAYIKPRLSQTSWVVWAYSWTPLSAGKYTVLVRATDGQGNLQAQRVTDPYPNGATGWHSVVYSVR